MAVLSFHIQNITSSRVYFFCLFSSCRLVELLLSVHIPRYWGIATKCLSYAKASSDPFVYCLLRQQYRKVLISVISRILGKDKYSLSTHSISSTLDTTDDNCIARITWGLCVSVVLNLLTPASFQDRVLWSTDGKESLSCSKTLKPRVGTWDCLGHSVVQWASCARHKKMYGQWELTDPSMCAKSLFRLYRLLFSTGLCQFAKDTPDEIHKTVYYYHQCKCKFKVTLNLSRSGLHASVKTEKKLYSDDCFEANTKVVLMSAIFNHIYYIIYIRNKCDDL